jgi:hypothetical protein
MHIMKKFIGVILVLIILSPHAQAAPAPSLEWNLGTFVENYFAGAAQTEACGPNPHSQACINATNTIKNIASNETAQTLIANEQILNSSAMNTTDLANFTNTIDTAGLTMAARFNNGQSGYANVLLDILGGIAFTWLGLMIMLSQADVWHMGLRPMFMLAITFGLAKWFLEDYNTLVAQVVGGFSFAGAILAGSSSSSIWSIAGLFLHQIMQIYTAIGQAITGTFASGSLLTTLDHEADDIFFGIVVVGITVILAIAAIIFMVSYIVYHIAVAIAFAVGPVFIPFMVLPITKFLFEGWMKFLITTGLYLMSAWVLVGLLGTGFTQFASTLQVVASSQTANSGLVNMGVLLEMTAFATACALSMLKIPEYAHAMAGSLSLGGLNPASAATSAATKGKIK